MFKELKIFLKTVLISLNFLLLKRRRIIFIPDSLMNMFEKDWLYALIQTFISLNKRLFRIHARSGICLKTKIIKRINPV